MFQAIQISNNTYLALFCAPPDLPSLAPEAVSRHKPDARWMLTNSRGDVAARCSLWWSAAPPYSGQRLGLIGHYAARDAGVAAQLLSLACDPRAAGGRTMAVGPMDGNTWQRYRLLTERGSEPIFFLEPDNPDDWPAHFTGNGFSVLARYTSALDTDLGRPDPRLAKVAERATARGVQIRSLDPGRFEAELGQIYKIARSSFSGNFLYTPLGEADFIAQYRSLQPYIRPELVLIAQRKEQPIGFIFALPDLLQTRKGQAIDTVILKTVALHPDHQSGGLGSLLVAHCQEIAHRLGYRRAIHALMHETNESGKISRRNEARMIRRYALFAREL